MNVRVVVLSGVSDQVVTLDLVIDLLEAISPLDEANHHSEVSILFNN